jgi:flagellar hook-length control protein FliK
MGAETLSTPNIDILMKTAAPAAKAPPTNAPHEESDSFGNYLRDAAETNSASTEKPAAMPLVAKDEPAEEQSLATTAGQGQGSTATPDQETIPTELLETTTEDEVIKAVADEFMTDEVILSVAAGAMVEAEIVANVPVVVEPTDNLVEVVNPTVTQAKAPTNVIPLSQAVPAPLETVDASEITTTCSEGENGNDEKLIPIEPILADEKAVEVSKNVVAKNSGLTPVVEAPKAAVAPKPIKPIIPAATTEFGSSKKIAPVIAETGKDKKTADPIDGETVEVDTTTTIVEMLAKVVETPTIETPTIATDTIANEAKTESATPAPATPTAIGGAQNQHSIEPHATHTEAPVPQADGESHMPTIDRARFVQRVANAFRSAQQNDGQIQMRLSPPELGSLKIEIAVRNGVLSANLEAETPDARRVLLDNLPALRQRLAEQDIRIEKFEVDIRQDGGQQQGQAEAQQQQTEQQSQRAAARNRIRTSPQHEAITTPKALLGKPAVARDGLDVRV